MTAHLETIVPASTAPESRAPAAAPEPRHDSNNFGLLRLILSMLVLLSHSFPTTRGLADEREPLAVLTGGGPYRISFGFLAVSGFFIISGYLVTQSWQRDPTAGAFIRKRVLRVYPGYLVAFAFSIVIGIAGSAPDALKYVKLMVWESAGLLTGALFMDNGVLNRPIAFATNPWPQVVNGSLWTLQPELRCYGILLALGMLGLLRDPRTVRVLAVGTFAWFAMLAVATGGIDPGLAHLLPCFLIGSVAASLPTEWFRRKEGYAIAALAVLVALAAAPLLLFFALPFLGAYVLFGMAYSRIRIFPRFFGRWDASYGVYLYAFPVQQMVAKAGVRSPWLMFAIATPIVLALAVASWKVIEQPALRLKSRPLVVLPR